VGGWGRHLAHAKAHRRREGGEGSHARAHRRREGGEGSHARAHRRREERGTVCRRSGAHGRARMGEGGSRLLCNRLDRARSGHYRGGNRAVAWFDRTLGGSSATFLRACRKSRGSSATFLRAPSKSRGSSATFL